MFETSGSLLSQQYSPSESSAFRSCMIAPVNIRQPEVLPASVNPCRVLPYSGFNDFGIPGWPENSFANDGISSIGSSKLYSPAVLCTPNRPPSDQLSVFPRLGEKPWSYETPCPEQRKFLVFDQCGNETRLMFSSVCPGAQNLPFTPTLCPGVENLPVTPTLCPVWSPQLAPAKPFDPCKYFLERQARKDEQMCTKTPIIYEESGENDFFDEEPEMREDTEEIDALLYSDDNDDDHDNDYDDKDDDEVSSGRSPLAREAVCNKQEEHQESDSDADVAFSCISLKRRKALDGGHETIASYTTSTRKTTLASEKNHSGDFISALDEEIDPTIGSKRPRMDEIRDTLKVLESLLPGLKNNDPVAILDEAISYLKCLKYDAESMSTEDSDSSGCYEPSH